MNFILLAVFGLVIGSFLGAFSWRLPRGIKIVFTRSQCPNCKHKLSWFDNIPLISFFLLKGKCRYCHKKISWRYPLIEITTATIFVAVVSFPNLLSQNIAWLENLTFLRIPFFLFFFSLLILIFVIDFEQQIIPDPLVFGGLGICFFYLFLIDSSFLYTYLLAGCGAAVFLLLIHLFTQGKGMGLGDVKLSILMASVLGIKNTLVWLFLAFLIGGLVASLLLLSKKKHLGEKVAFAPFLVISFIITAFLGVDLQTWFLAF